MKQKLIQFNIFSKKVLIRIGASLIGIVVFIWIVMNFFISSRPHTQEASLLLAFENNGKGRTFQGEVVDGMTVLDALIVSSGVGQINFQHNIDVNNIAHIISLDGYNKVSAQKHLVFYLNERRVDESEINTTKIKPGDVIRIVLE